MDRGPFLVLAPLSTLSHWQREVEAWTDLHGVVFHGGVDARSVIMDYEWAGVPREEVNRPRAKAPTPDQSCS